MSALIDIVLPVFVIAFLGFGAGRFNLMSEQAVGGLASFVYYLATPALVIRALATARTPGVEDLSLVWAYFGGTLLVFLVAWVTGRRLLSLTGGHGGAMAMSTVFANTVLLGIPIVYTAFGDAGIVQLMIIIALHSAILMPLSIIAIEAGRRSGRGFLVTGKDTVKLLIRNPVMISAVVGVSYGASGWDLPLSVERFMTLLGGASVPCALFALGASLGRFNMGGALSPVVVASGFKLIIHPLAVGLLAYGLFNLDPIPAAVALITAALPTGVNVFIVAQQHKVFVARSASVILVTTILAIPILALILTQVLPVN